MGNRPKFIEPMLSDATSGWSSTAGRMRSATVIAGPPPVVTLTTAFDACLIRGRKARKASGSWVGRPSAGTRACRWTMAAPASAAPMAAAAIASGVTGRCGDIDGVWIEPVTAQVTITLLVLAAMDSFTPARDAALR